MSVQLRTAELDREMKTRGLTSVALARAARVSTPTIFRARRGDRVTETTWLKIQTALVNAPAPLAELVAS